MIKKILCSLIIGLGLISFSSASVITGAIPGDFYNNEGGYSYSYFIDKNLNFSTNSQYKTFYYTIPNLYNGGGTGPRSWALFWNDGKIAGYGNQKAVPKIIKQGYYNSFCYSSLSSFESDCVILPAGCPGNYITPIQEFYNLGAIYDSFYFNSNDPTVPFLCFLSSSKNVASCFGINITNNSSYGELNCFIDDEPILQGIFDNPGNFDQTKFQDSPFISSSNSVSIPDYEFNDDDIYTNKQIIEGYNAMGLTDDFCYGGFDIDNIFEAGTVPQQFTGYMWGGGAFIFDIWDIYSGAYNNDYISFLRSFYISYENNNYSDFYGKTKALYGFINQWFSVSSKGLGFIESTAPTFTLVDVWQYCDLRFNQNPDSIYTGDRWDPKFRYYTSGQVNLGGYFNFSGNNNYFSGNLSGFNTPKDFFASLNSIFQGGLNNLEHRSPILPTYIIVFFLAIIFIRIISH